jgi:hypothetical protein
MGPLHKGRECRSYRTLSITQKSTPSLYPRFIVLSFVDKMNKLNSWCLSKIFPTNTFSAYKKNVNKFHDNHLERYSKLSHFSLAQKF